MIKDIHHKLVERCKKNDKNAQREVFDLYADAMFNTANRIVNNQMLAKDVLQESFIKVFTTINSFEQTSTLGAWIKRIVVNQALNELKKNRFESLDDNYRDLEEDTDMPIEWTVEAIKRSMEQLPNKARTVFSLYAFEGYDHSEIAEIMKISVEGSKSQYSRAKKKIRELVTLESCKKI